MPGVVYINGVYYPPGEARISVYDRGFLYGDGVFETVRAYAGSVFHLSRHLERLEYSSAQIRMKAPARAELEKAVLGTLAKGGLAEAVLRLSVTRGEGWQSAGGQNSSPTVVVMAGPVSARLAEQWENGVRAIVAGVRRNPPEALPPGAKSMNYLNCILARMEAQNAGADEAVMLNLAGEVAEGSSSNIFAVKDGVLYTPDLQGILAGITRETVLELAAGAGISVRQTALKVDDLATADEIFLTNSTWEVMPVTMLDGRRVKSGLPGPVTSRLMKSYRELVDRECQRA